MQTCPAGFFCPLNTSLPFLCLPGSFCPNATRSAEEFLCPPGTYNNKTGLTTLIDCTSCPPGYFCDQPGLSTPSGKCSPGYFCGGGSYTSHPLASTNSSGLVISSRGEKCVEYINATINDLCPPGFHFIF